MGQGTKGLHGEGAALHRFLEKNRSDLGYGGSRTSLVGLSSTQSTPVTTTSTDSTSTSLMYLAGAAVLFYIIYGSK